MNIRWIQPFVGSITSNGCCITSVNSWPTHALIYSILNNIPLWWSTSDYLAISTTFCIGTPLPNIIDSLDSLEFFMRWFIIYCLLLSATIRILFPRRDWIHNFLNLGTILSFHGKSLFPNRYLKIVKQTISWMLWGGAHLGWNKWLKLLC